MIKRKFMVRNAGSDAKVLCGLISPIWQPYMSVMLALKVCEEECLFRPRIIYLKYSKTRLNPAYLDKRQRNAIIDVMKVIGKQLYVE